MKKNTLNNRALQKDILSKEKSIQNLTKNLKEHDLALAVSAQHNEIQDRINHIEKAHLSIVEKFHHICNEYKNKIQVTEILDYSDETLPLLKIANTILYEDTPRTLYGSTPFQGVSESLCKLIKEGIRG